MVAFLNLNYAQVAKSVDARHLKCLAERHTGSTPVLGTKSWGVAKW